jgi:hypothetical protein
LSKYILSVPEMVLELADVGLAQECANQIISNYKKKRKI